MTMPRTKLSLATVALCWLLSLGLYGCGGDDGDDSNFPNIRGGYRGTLTETDSGCRNARDNGTFTDTVTVNISSQNNADFSGTLVDSDGNTVNIAGQINAGGGLSGTFTVSSGGFASQSTFTGTLAGNTLTVDYSGRVTAGDTCVFQGRFTGTR